MKYDERLHLRLTANQKENLKRQSLQREMGLRDYIILCCLENPTEQADAFKADIQELNSQLKHIGRNINQIARRINSKQHADFRSIKKEFFFTMRKANKILEALK